MKSLEKEKVYVSWWQNEALKMHSKLDKFTARIAFSAGYRLASAQPRSHLTAFGVGGAVALVGVALGYIIALLQFGGR